ncbi:polypeptide-transport-associated domain-containing protein [Oscillochloris trichoides DG-6]|uniref:Polypeptide-transport-associated domain-containing protein n=1 Tax=Oscillochloris trichoides DG-6 TaxID=765420 RepID=E1IHI5_9CHLR|nr:polypeptide-transport-associated domain-containing protein [Oscillochloris trichoides DG-6]
MARQGRSGPGPGPGPGPGGSHVRPNAWRALLSGLRNGRVVSLLIFLTCVGILGYLLTQARFSVLQIEVIGNNALHTEDVITESGLLGRPIWFVNPAESEAQLRANPYVESVQVQIGLPNQARIHVVERRPEVRWEAGGVEYLVDGRGQVLAVAQEDANDDVLVVIDTSTPDLKPGDQIDTDALSLTRALALRLPTELGFTPAQIGWDFGVGVYVRSQTGQTIIFGQNRNLDRKLAILATLIKEQTAFTYLDLRSGNPFYQNSPQN